MKVLHQDRTLLELEARPKTGYFFGAAQLFLGLCFLYIYFQPNSSKEITLVLTLIFLGLGFLTLLLSTTVSITVDKSKNAFQVRRKSLLISSVQAFDIDEIGQVTVEGSGGLNRDRYWDVILQFKNGQSFYLVPTSTDSQQQMQIANLIDIFLEFKLNF